MNNELKAKIEHSIERMLKAEKLALLMQPEHGFYLGFSGGKDSQVLLELAKMANVRYRAIHNVTTNDPADNIRFIKQYYSDVEFDIPEQSYFTLIETNGLPTMNRRWCCERFKETKATGYTVLTGVRAEESKKRSQYSEFNRVSRRKEVRGVRDLDFMADNHFVCVKGRDKYMLYPILAWTEQDVWDFIKDRELPINPCYNTAYRVGCVFCPYSNKAKIQSYIKTHPKQFQILLQHLQVYLDRERTNNIFTKAYDAFMWWCSKVSVKKYNSNPQKYDILH